MGWSIVPWGFRKLLLWVQARYRWVCKPSPRPCPANKSAAQSFGMPVAELHFLSGKKLIAKPTAPVRFLLFV